MDFTREKVKVKGKSTRLKATEIKSLEVKTKGYPANKFSSRVFITDAADLTFYPLPFTFKASSFIINSFEITVGRFLYLWLGFGKGKKNKPRF
jgi:hypothetical protein